MATGKLEINLLSASGLKDTQLMGGCGACSLARYSAAARGLEPPAAGLLGSCPPQQPWYPLPAATDQPSSLAPQPPRRQAGPLRCL